MSAKNEATGYTLNTTSGSGGAFRFPSVPIGLYDITVSNPGFSPVTQTGVSVQISTTTAVNITLSVGKAEQAITVRADATKIETESSDIGTVVSAKQVLELPLALGGVGAMRSPEAFVFLAPGTVGPGTANSNNGIFIFQNRRRSEFRSRCPPGWHQYSAVRKRLVLRRGRTFGGGDFRV